jgi:hypothetical protein
MQHDPSVSLLAEGGGKIVAMSGGARSGSLTNQVGHVLEQDRRIIGRLNPAKRVTFPRSLASPAPPAPPAPLTPLAATPVATATATTTTIAAPGSFELPREGTGIPGTQYAFLVSPPTTVKSTSPLTDDTPYRIPDVHNTSALMNRITNALPELLKAPSVKITIKIT